MTAETIARQRFLDEYRHIRYAEGRGSDCSEYYRALPHCERSDPLFPMWVMRSKTYSYFERRILRNAEVNKNGPLDIIDLGAGNCWLSHQLSLRNHHPVAVDIFSDERDGLRAVRHYPKPFPVIECDFDQLPLPSRSFDLAVFNASLHYSSDYIRTLTEVRRCLRPSGSIVILDSPVYRLPEHGKQMVHEKHAEFLRRYGFSSDALPSVEFLDRTMLRILQQRLELKWRIYKPWYGWRWHVRPLRAFLQGRRLPSKFWILVGRFHQP